MVKESAESRAHPGAGLTFPRRGQIREDPHFWVPPLVMAGFSRSFGDSHLCVGTVGC